MSKARAYQLTLNEIEKYEGLLEYLKTLKPSYLISCKEEAPSTGHEHIHIYVQFPTPRALSIKKTLGAHIEKCKGSPQQNVAYIKKEGNIIDEEGELKKAGARSIEEVKKMAKSEREQLPCQLYNIVQKINAEEAKKLTPQSYKKTVAVFWYYGPSGAGKTTHALKEIGERQFNEVKFDGNFWHGVQEDCDIALYDDWRDTHMKPTELINFIDYNSHIMNIKGSTIRNKYKEIYITSLQNPEEIYRNKEEEEKKQWLRRIKEIVKFEIVPQGPCQEKN